MVKKERKKKITHRKRAESRKKTQMQEHMKVKSIEAEKVGNTRKGADGAESKKVGDVKKIEDIRKKEVKEEEKIADEVFDELLSRDFTSLRRKASETVRKIETSKSGSRDSVKTPFSFLLKDVSKYQLLSPEEERRLAIRFRKYRDREAAKRLALANLRFVIKMALDYRNWGVPIEDLVSEGIIGLLFAIRKFDPSKGVKFISYASYWIRAFIHNCILNNFSIIKLGTTQDERKIFANIFKIRDETREEDIQDQSKKLNVDEEKIKLMSARVRSRDISLDTPQDDEGSLKLADILTADESSDPVARAEIEDSKDFINKGLADAFLTLASQEQQVIRQRYLSLRPKTLKELSDELKISKERIRQIEKRAFQKLRTALSKYAKTFRIDMLKDKVRRKRRSREEMELARMIESHAKRGSRRRKKRRAVKPKPEFTEFFDFKEL